MAQALIYIRLYLAFALLPTRFLSETPVLNFHLLETTLSIRCPFKPAQPRSGFIHPFVHSVLDNQTVKQPLLPSLFLHRKEVIQPHLPIRLPCYDFTPVIGSTFGSSLLSVGSLTSGISDSHGVTGGVYKTRERIHRDMLIRDY